MKRRAFIGSSVLGGVAATGISGRELPPDKRPPGRPAAGETGLLAGKNLKELRDGYRRILFDEYFPYLERYARDTEYGGFMCNSHPDGVRIDTNKNAWYDGRGLYLYSCLYTTVTPDPAYRAFLDKTAALILRMKPGGNEFWPGTYTREGSPLTPGEIYCDLFIALGLQEYAKLPGNERYREEAKALLVKCLRVYDRPDYAVKIFLADAPPITGPRMLGHWMIIIRVASRMLESGDDPEVRAILDRSIDAIMNYHFNPSYGLMNETINHDLSRPGNAYARWCYTGHSIEVLWFIMDEAVRRGDAALFDTAAERFMRHVEVAWDDVYTGVMRSINDIEKDTRTLDIVLLFQMEALIGSMLLVEHTGSPWAVEWFGRIHDHITTKYEPGKFGYSPWMRSGDRVPAETYSYRRIGNYHYPQALLLNMLALDRIIGRGGTVSGRFG